MTHENCSITEMLARRLESSDEIILTVVAGDNSELAITAAEYRDRAMAFAARFGPAAGAPRLIGICLDLGLDLHAAYVGAIWAGHIPTMLAPPSPRMDPEKYSRSLAAQLTHLRPELLITTSGIASGLAAQNIRTDTTEIIDPSGLSYATDMPYAVPALEDVCLLQHSSGTTGLNKGISLSHRAILAQAVAYGKAINLSHQDTIVSWLPLYHDMGLIACFILPLISGARIVQMSPFDWVARPGNLLDVISRHQGTLCWLPNFAFSFMADRVRNDAIPEGTDLASVRAWINSSEPVQPAAMERFVNHFGAFGVRREAMAASYAMAENVYAVTQTSAGPPRHITACPRTLATDSRIKQDTSDRAITFGSSGMPIEGTEVTIVDDKNQRMPNLQVGSILIKGSSLFSGYYEQSDLTDRAMTGDGWYKTGDLGFIDNGELFVTGRGKDLIIIQGRNFDPLDIESRAAALDGVIPGRVVAFGIPDPAQGTERLVILFESDQATARETGMTAKSIRREIAQALDCTPAVVRAVPARWIVKSTSGKIARNDNCEKYMRDFEGGNSS